MAKLHEAPRKTLPIDSVLDGQAASGYFSKKGQFLFSIAIDPEAVIGSQVKPGGAITPVGFSKFSSTAVSGSAMWIMDSPKNTKVYEYLDNGYLIRHDNNLASETSIGQATTASLGAGAGNGGAYYNNYLYLFAKDDVSRYGPLNNSPSLTNNWWNGTVGLTKLTNTTYPGDHGITFPNHAAHQHYGKLYFCDFLNGQGYIHFIQTSKITDEGDTNNGSTYNTTFLLPLGYYPFDIESYGGDLVILCSQISGDPTIKVGKAALFFWDTFSTKAYKQIDLPDSVGTALYTQNGVPYIWSGEIGRGVRLSYYTGGNQIKGAEYFTEGTPPPAGAVDAFGQRIAWGGYGTYPSAFAGIYAKGYVNPNLPGDALNHIGRWSGSGTIPTISALKFVQAINKYPLLAWTDNADTADTLPQAYGIDKTSGSATINSVFRTEVISPGQPFQITKIRIPLGAAVATGMSVAVKVYVDDESASTSLDTINPTNDNGKMNALRYTLINGKHNFFLEFTMTGTAVLPVLLPIEIDVTYLGD